MNTSAPNSDQDDTQGVQTPVSQLDPVIGISAPAQQGKEYEPGQSLTEYASLPGSELEPDLAPELKEAGVEHSPNTERPTLTVQDKRLGIQHGVDAVSHPMTTPGNNLPMTKTEATAILENRKIGFLESIKWRAKNIFRQDEKEEAKK